MRSRRAASAPSLILAALSALAGLAGSPPEVVRVRVPESRVAAFFPTGSDLHVLSPDRFEQLVRDAGRPPTPAWGPPRLVRASHEARWEGGMLAGRSLLTAAPADGGKVGLLALEPWSPSLSDGATGRKLARVAADGRLGLRIGEGDPGPVRLDWRLRARPGSDGSAFLLDLPEADVASLVLDLPEGLTPTAGGGPRFLRSAPTSPGRGTWKTEAARGRLAIRLIDERGSRSLWLSGPTRIDLNERGANWRADWTLEGTAGLPATLTLELDPGLDLVDVAGPLVAASRPEPREDGSRVTIQLEPGAGTPSPLTLRGVCRVPPDRPWSIPSARPVGAIWTGGRTTVRLDPSRVLQSCDERSGRRVAPRSGDPMDSSALCFEPGPTSGPVADLTFHKPTFDATSEIRGYLRLGPEIPRFDATMEWRVERNRLPSHAVDLSSGWTPERVTALDGQAVAWHAERLANGSIRVHMASPADEASDRPQALTLRASAPQAGITGPLNLPRVRPATPSVRVSDEVWVATVAPSLTARPSFGGGLAWIDPPRRQPPGEPPTSEARSPGDG